MRQLGGGGRTGRVRRAWLEVCRGRPWCGRACGGLLLTSEDIVRAACDFRCVEANRSKMPQNLKCFDADGLETHAAYQ